MKYTLRPNATSSALAERMSLREAIHQVCCPLLNFEPRETLGGAHVPRGTRSETIDKIQALRAVCDIPPLCTADLECGPGRAVLGLTEFPDLMALGANDSEQLAYDVGKATALEARSVGLDWTFSPCVDRPRTATALWSPRAARDATPIGAFAWRGVTCSACRITASSGH
jgi:beta-glucosidase-like glycosyl hydrolase